MSGKRAALPEGGVQKDGVVWPEAKPGQRFAALEGTSFPATKPPADGGGTIAAHSPGRERAEQRLVGRVFERCQAAILLACKFSTAPPEFLGALTANESGGDASAARFEPAVYRHLAAVVSGQSPAYGSIHCDDLRAELGRVLHPKADEFHAQFLPPALGANHRQALAALPDEGLRELATSWGYTQIMGYHMVGRSGTVRDLLEPAFHYRVALELLAEFAAAFQLDLAREFSEMFSCWNTGQPYGKCWDPHYVENGLHRMGIYAERLKGKG
ncbi:MAG TPA: hypothetical protein VG028_04190 [Terriglobia bacterium]|nr:hypothetical protein [Terriglobia bacterium]